MPLTWQPCQLAMSQVKASRIMHQRGWMPLEATQVNSCNERAASGGCSRWPESVKTLESGQRRDAVCG